MTKITCADHKSRVQQFDIGNESAYTCKLGGSKGLLQFAQAKEVHKSQDICYWGIISKKMFSSWKNSKKHHIPVKGSFLVMNTQPMVSSKETSQGTYFVGSWGK